MFSILKKQQDSVSAEDLEILQNEIEKNLVKVVTQRWELERDLLALNSNSPDSNNSQGTSLSQNQATASANQISTHNNPTNANANANSQSGKLRTSNRLNLIDPTENSTDGFKGSLFNSNNGATGTSSGATNSTEDSVSSEGSLVSSLTSSTIITSTVADLGSHTQTTNSASATAPGTKRSHKASTNSSSTNERPSKRFRQNSNNNNNSLSNPSNNPAAQTKRLPHSKHRSKIVPSKFRNSFEESRPNKKQIFKNEAPDKLWPFVEQFCATPTQKQIFDLEEMINAMENDKEYFKIPALGKKDSVKDKDSPTKLENSSAASTPVASKKKSKNSSNKANNHDEESSNNLGALTQRLVSSFFEDSESINNVEPSKKKSKYSKSSAANNQSSGVSSTKGNLDMNQAKNLEKKIRQGLEEYEILDQRDDIPYTSEEDEVLRDLVASQHELLSIQSENKLSMERLLERAKKHVELEIERAKLREANADVIAAYHRLIQAKQKKRNPTKKEKDAAWKALKVQEAIFEKCDELYLSSLNRS